MNMSVERQRIANQLDHFITASFIFESDARCFDFFFSF